jgi:hypothetical protein
LYLLCKFTSRNRFIPPSWQPQPPQTSGELEQWRGSLRNLGTELSVISIFSFTFKVILVGLQYTGVLINGSSLQLGLSTLLVEALPTIIIVGLLVRYHRRSLKAGGGAATADLAISLLQEESRSRVLHVLED